MKRPLALAAALLFALAACGCGGGEEKSPLTPEQEWNRVALFEGSATDDTRETFSVSTRRWVVQPSWSFDGSPEGMSSSSITVKVLDGQGNEVASREARTAMATGIGAERVPDYREYPDIPDMEFDNGPGEFHLEIRCGPRSRWLVTVWDDPPPGG